MKLRGTIRRIGIEGGVWALVTEEGHQFELVGVPEPLMNDGVEAEIVADRRGVDATIGMMGDAVRVTSYTILARS